MTVERTYFLHKIDEYFQNHSVVAILGPRQCGKTTLARKYIKHYANNAPNNYFDLEDDIDIQRLSNPQLAFSKLEGLIVIDEIQLRPELFPTLRVLVDHEHNRQRFLILGSASRELLQQSSESLAGRIAYLELPPFSINEVDDTDRLWMRGGFPKSYLADTMINSINWREFYITSFLEQDIPNLGINIPAQTLRRFWAMIAHYHGNVINFSEIGRSFGISDNTVRKYLDILTGTFMIRQLVPWHENMKKRQVKSPKIYIRDSGLFHSLMDINDNTQLMRHPKLGASWEGFALEEIIQALHAKNHQCYFWATHSGAELDLLIMQKNQRQGFEFKYQDAPKLTKSMSISFADLKLDGLTVIYPGNKSYYLTENILVCGLWHFIHNLQNN